MSLDVELVYSTTTRNKHRLYGTGLLMSSSAQQASGSWIKKVFMWLIEFYMVNRILHGILKIPIMLVLRRQAGPGFQRGHAIVAVCCTAKSKLSFIRKERAPTKQNTKQSVEVRSDIEATVFGGPIQLAMSGALVNKHWLHVLPLHRQSRLTHWGSGRRRARCFPCLPSWS